MVHLDNVIHMYVYLDINYILYLNVHLNFKILELIIYLVIMISKNYGLIEIIRNISIEYNSKFSSMKWQY